MTRSQKDIVDAYKHVFNTNEGKIVLDDMCKAGCLYSPIISSDALEMAFREGGRNAVLRILAILEKQPTME